MDDGQGGSFTSLIGYTSPYLMPYYVATGLTKGRTYKFRYRAKNVNGWGEFSNEVSILAADAPDAPSFPTMTSVDATNLVLQLYSSHNNGGSIVTDYHLFMNSGTDGSALTEVTDYDFSTDQFAYTVNYAALSMT